MPRTPLAFLALLLLTTAAFADTADVSVALKTVERAVTGGPFPVSVSLHNAGPDLAVGARVRIEPPNLRFVPLENLPGCLREDGGAILCHINDFAAGQTRELNFTFTANENAGPMSIRATALTTNDPNATNDSANASVEVFAAADLNLTVDVYPSLQPLQHSQVRFFVRNLSTTPAGPFTGLFSIPSTVKVMDVPSHCEAVDATTYRCDFAGLAFGLVAAAFDIVPDDVDSVTFTGSVERGGDANSADDRVTHVEPVYRVAQLALSITSPDRLDESRIGAVRYRIENTSDIAAHDVVFEISSGFTTQVARYAADGWSCTSRSAPDPGVRCTTTTVAPHESREIVLDVLFPAREVRVVFFASATRATPPGFRALPISLPADGVLYRVFDVTTVADSGPGSLRTAIESANAQCGNDNVNIPCKIAFRIAAPVPVAGWFTIAPHSPLPRLTAPDVAIDAEAQKALTGDTNSDGPEVFLDGSQAGDCDGLSSTSTIAIIRGLAIGNFARNGLLLDRGAARIPTSNLHHRLERNYLGVDPTGTRAATNGLRGLMAFRFRGFIEGNVISANRRSGIFLEEAMNADIRGNRIGVAASTDDALPNGASGIYLGPRSMNVTIDGNLIANSGDFGIAVAPRSTVSILANRFVRTGQRAIDVGLDGASPDLAGIPVPIITTALYDEVSGETVIEGSGVPRRYPYLETIYLYVNDVDVAEGHRFVAAVNVDRNGRFVLRVREDLRGAFLTASGVILTDFGDLISRNSTEMSAGKRVE